MEKPYQVISREEIYKGKIIEVVKDTITLPENKTAKRELVLHSDAAAIVPIDAEGNIILVKQYRHPFGEMVYEIPAGLVEKGEDPLLCAKRELEEETSFKCEDLSFVCKSASSIGFCNEIIYIYIAENLTQGEFNFDEDEFIEIYKFKPEKALEMIENGEIYDGKTILGIMAYLNYKKN